MFSISYRFKAEKMSTALMSNRKFIFKSLLFLTTVLYCSVDSAKILVPFPSVTRSHFLGLEPVLRELAKRGHEITVINSFDQENLPKNYRHIKTSKIDMNVMSKIFLESSENILRMFTNAPRLMELSTNEYRELLNNMELKQIMNDETFDLVITETFFGDMFLGLAAHFKCPTISYSSFKATNVANDVMRNPQALSYVANSFMSFAEPLSFRDRVFNMLWYILDLKVLSAYAKYNNNKLYEEFFPQPNYPTMQEMIHNISLLFVSHHFSQGNVRPYLPNMVEIGGTQISTEISIVQEDVEDWMDSSPHGLIYFSMGTVIQSSTLSDEKLFILLNVFRNLKQRVLWKFENDTLPGLPENVMIRKWLPQNTILQHPKLNVFITHGGWGSIMEAKYHSIPVIVIPVFGDQNGNADVIIAEGWGLKVHYTELSEKRLNDAIAEITKNSTYREIVKYESLLYRDRPLHPINTAIYWIEYVIRYRGAPHMRPNSFHLNFFQLHSLDVIGFLVITSLFIIYLVSRFIKCCFCKRKVFGESNLKKTQ